MRYKLNDVSPSVSTGSYIAPSADVIGNVHLEENASVWFNCVLRGDNDRITVGKNSNVQDGAILHVDPGFPLQIGENVTVGHKVMLHGCTIGNNTLIGMNAIILNGAKIGENCIIGAGALVTENMEIPDGSMALGSPAKVVKEVGDGVKKMLLKGAEHYVEKSAVYTEHLEALD
ncbi:MAG: gamma carbonic anhydrase family protein [Pseudomonadota bacterium]